MKLIGALMEFAKSNDKYYLAKFSNGVYKIGVKSTLDAYARKAGGKYRVLNVKASELRSYRDEAGDSLSDKMQARAARLDLLKYDD